jgi:hypothetical protein
MKPRTSLRGLMILTACVAAACWRLDLPRQRLNRFVAAVEAGDYERARAMVDADHARHIRLPRDFAAQWPNIPCGWGVFPREPSALDWLLGRRRFSVGGLGGPLGCTNTFTATAGGIRGPWQ